jgi:hypothetical protein
MKYAPPGAGDLGAIKSDGTVTAVVIGDGVTFPSTGIWYFPIGGDDAPLPGECPLVSIQLEWAAATAGTFTIEVCNFPRFKGGQKGQGAVDVDHNDGNATRTNWVQYNPTTLYVPTPTGAGNSATNLTVTAGGTNAGGTAIDIGNCGGKRLRVKAVIATVGRMRVNANGKAGG